MENMLDVRLLELLDASGSWSSRDKVEAVSERSSTVEQVSE